jgi:hypothetical protein
MAGALVVVFSTAGVPAFSHGVGAFARDSAAVVDGNAGNGENARMSGGKPLDNLDADLELVSRQKRNRAALAKPVQGLLSAVSASALTGTSGFATLRSFETVDGSSVCFASPLPAKSKKPGSSTHDGSDGRVLVAVLLKYPDAAERALSASASASSHSAPAAAAARPLVLLRTRALLSLAEVVANAAIACVGWDVAQDANAIRAPAAHAAFSAAFRPVLDSLFAAFAEGGPPQLDALPVEGMVSATGARPPNNQKKGSHLHTDVGLPLALSSCSSVERFVTTADELGKLVSICDAMREYAGERNCLGVALLLVDEREPLSSDAAVPASTSVAGRVRLLATTDSWVERLSAGESFAMVAFAAGVGRKRGRDAAPESIPVFLPQFSAGGALDPGRTQFRCICVSLRVPAPQRSDYVLHHRVVAAFVCNKAEPAPDLIASGAVPNALTALELEQIRGLLGSPRGGSPPAMSPLVADQVMQEVDAQVLAVILRTKRHGRRARQAEVCHGDALRSQVVYWERDLGRDPGGAVRSFSTGSSITSAMLSAPLTDEETQNLEVPTGSVVVTVTPSVAPSSKHVTVPTLEGIVLLGAIVPPYARTGVAQQAVNSFAASCKHIWQEETR